MNVLKHLIVVMSIAFIALLMTAVVFTAVSVRLPAPDDPPDFGWLFEIRVVFGVVMLFGTIPTLFIGAPAYVALSRNGLARWPYVLIIGLVPGLLVSIFFMPMVGIPLAIGGVIVAMSTHFLCRKLHPSSSFKPTPPRDAA